MSTTYKANGAVDGGPVRGQRTGADVVADVVSLVILAALGAFAVAVSFSHTMDFVRQHGQSERWIVVGTACTVVLLTLQAGLETFRDSRAGRGRGWPALLLAVGVGVELYANMSTAPGDVLSRAVAGWPVPVAAAALALWTRRLQHAAEAAEQAPAAAVEPSAAEHQDDDDQGDEVEHQDVDQDDDQGDEVEHQGDDQDDAEQGTSKERILRLLRDADAVPGPTEVALHVGCTKQYASEVIRAWKKEQEEQEPIKGQTALDWAAAAG
ncbi:hypothetical protein [Streptomyces laurentii]|uniref:hypothetical protein n=1 Tax=Streptomyces laurentii TaxID=39478 RepID=UPI0036805F75